jgi:transaldolase
MRFFLDTANLEELAEAAGFGLLDGVTTNPSLMAREGVSDQDARIREICALTPGPVSAEVLATDFEGMLAEGRHLAGLDQQQTDTHFFISTKKRWFFKKP